MHTPLAPRTLLHNRYLLVGLAGRGKFGQRYLACDQLRSHQLCVIREFVPVDQEPMVLKALWQRFQKAAASIYKLNHPQLPRVQVMIFQGNRFYWVQEYIDGKSYGLCLDERSTTGDRFCEAEVVQFLEQVLPVLKYLHQNGIVHQNICLDSIILRQADQLPVLVDFGAVKRLVARLQIHPVQPDTRVGLWSYLAPEQRDGGQPSPATDLYALGVTAIALLTGREPDELYNERQQRFEWESEAIISSPFAQVLQRLVHPQRHQRFSSANQVLRALQEFQTLPLAPDVALPKPAIGQKNRSRFVAMSAPAPIEPDLPKPAPREDDRPAIPAVAIAASFLKVLHLTDINTQATARLQRLRLWLIRSASLALGTSLALLIALIAWRVLSSLQLGSQPEPTLPPPPTTASGSSSSASPVPVPTLPPLPPAVSPNHEQYLTAALKERRNQLAVNSDFFSALVEDEFSARHSSQAAQPGVLSETERAEWSTIASSLLDRLATLSPQTRSKLGSYARRNYDQWLGELGETGPSSLTLDQLADNRFFELFPEQKGKTQNPRTYGQIWYAIAEEQLGVAKAQKQTMPQADRSER